MNDHSHNASHAQSKPTQPPEGDAEVPHIIEFRWAKAGETDNAPVVDHKPEPPTAPRLEAVPSNASVDTDEVPRYMVRFAGD
jgi:hypothetical protein